MKKMLLLLLFTSAFASAKDTIHFRLVHKVIQNINVKEKHITINNENYPLRLERLEDIYYLSFNKTRSLYKLPINKKYYIEFKYKNKKDFDQYNNAYVSYIGTLKPPF